MLAGVVGVVGVTVSGCAASGSTAAKDVTITACTPSPTGDHPTVTGTIVNHSTKASGYTIHVKFTDSTGNGVGDGATAVAKVDAGATAKWDAKGSVNAKGRLKCALSQVTRNVSP
ncbi:MAG: hypothetical protein NVS3B21_28410 [Acidimicrobiales bacterium]